LGELLRQEVSRLGTAVTTTLEIAAVIGRQFNFGLLHQVSPLSEWELLDILDTALTARLIAESDEGYRFHHGLIRHVLYEGSEPGQAHPPPHARSRRPGDHLAAVRTGPRPAAEDSGISF
jgi:hypothetical protein